jgi:hypothetical protein
LKQKTANHSFPHQHFRRLSVSMQQNAAEENKGRRRENSETTKDPAPYSVSDPQTFAKRGRKSYHLWYDTYISRYACQTSHRQTSRHAVSNAMLDGKLINKRAHSNNLKDKNAQTRSLNSGSEKPEKGENKKVQARVHT